MRLFGLLQLLQGNLLGDGVVDDGVREVEGLVFVVGDDDHMQDIFAVGDVQIHEIGAAAAPPAIQQAEALVHLDDFILILIARLSDRILLEGIAQIVAVGILRVDGEEIRCGIRFDFDLGIEAGIRRTIILRGILVLFK